MVKGLYTAYTGMKEEQRRLDVLSNNLANASTNGYKKEVTINQAFDERLALRIKDSGNNDMPARLGGISMGDDVGEVYTDWSQGSFKVTDVKSNLAVAGDGFFAVSYTNKNTGEKSEYCFERFDKYRCTDFSRFH